MQPSANANQLAAAGHCLQVLLHDTLDEQHHQTIHRNRNADCKQCRDGVALQKLIEHMIAAKRCRRHGSRADNRLEKATHDIKFRSRQSAQHDYIKNACNQIAARCGKHCPQNVNRRNPNQNHVQNHLCNGTQNRTDHGHLNMSNPLQNPRRGLAERKEDNRNTANRQQCTAVACTGEQHVDNLRPKRTDTNRCRHRNNHGNAIGQRHFSAYLLPLLQFYRCGNARQSRCCNRRRNRNGQCGQRNIFPRKLSIQRSCILFGKSNLLQNSYHHPHINQVGNAEYRRTCDDRPCRLQNSALKRLLPQSARLAVRPG